MKRKIGLLSLVLAGVTIVAAAYSAHSARIRGLLPPGPPASYQVVPGDTLSRLALQFYGSVKWWWLLADSNRDVVDNPNGLVPGMVLQIPTFSSFTDAQKNDAKRLFPSWRNFPHGPVRSTRVETPKPPASTPAPISTTPSLALRFLMDLFPAAFGTLIGGLMLHYFLPHLDAYFKRRPTPPPRLKDANGFPTRAAPIPIRPSGKSVAA
jgi:LysM repeat protein